MLLKISNKKRESVRFPFCLMAESEGYFFQLEILTFFDANYMIFSNMYKIHRIYLLGAVIHR